MKTRLQFRFRRGSFPAAVLALAIGGGCASYQEQARKDALVTIERDTGLKTTEVPGTEGSYLGKIHRGYRVLYTGKAGDVWGRYAARLTMGEIGREVGGVAAFLTGSYEYGPGAAGSPLDRLLAEAIGQPLSVTMILVHGKAGAPRLDILSDYANIEPDDPQPQVARIGWGAGSLYSSDRAFADRVLADAPLIERLGDLRGAYIRVDGEAVSLFWAGQETDFSSMINDHGGYSEMLNAFLDDLADLADDIPARPAGAPG
ncbi:MAG TPA: hypothetical protein PK636_05490 [bacterium]|nr:hypothetical protein [bacterium]HPJ72118.1 hypothetical protein [bacterium]HPQ66067.1 hypothetical protein [bacterium]